MDIILLERIEKLGGIGDVVSVKDGYARNFLLPNKKALRANDANRKVFEANRSRIEADNASRRGEAEKHAADVEGKQVAGRRRDGGDVRGSERRHRLHRSAGPQPRARRDPRRHVRARGCRERRRLKQSDCAELVEALPFFATSEVKDSPSTGSGQTDGCRCTPPFEL
jgi:hypothetical protein